MLTAFFILLAVALLLVIISFFATGPFLQIALLLTIVALIANAVPEYQRQRANPRKSSERSRHRKIK